MQDDGRPTNSITKHYSQHSDTFVITVQVLIIFGLPSYGVKIGKSLMCPVGIYNNPTYMVGLHTSSSPNSGSLIPCGDCLISWTWIKIQGWWIARCGLLTDFVNVCVFLESVVIYYSGVQMGRAAGAEIAARVDVKLTTTLPTLNVSTCSLHYTGFSASFGKVLDLAGH